MSSPDGLPPLREVIAEHNLSARKSLGQNFLLDMNLTGRIARSAGDIKGKKILEIGPGPGGLTRALLLEGASQVIAIERDRRCIEALETISQHYPGRLTIIADDALEADYEHLLDQGTRIIANLPYGIATPLLIKWLQMQPWPPPYQSMTLMFQREVAERIVATPGSKTYGRLSVMAQWRTEAKIKFHLPAKAFTPPPKVDSALVEFIPRVSLEIDCDVEKLEKVTAAAFGQRRKMLRSSLKQITSDPIALLKKAAIDPAERAENISVLDFCRISQLAFD